MAIGTRILERSPDERLARQLGHLKAAQATLHASRSVAERVPYFCPGCPHNTSTVVPEGSRAYAGIGCHYMAQYMDRSTEGYTQMGGEGANWVGEAPFSTRGHVFQNLGDGTYNHSGSLAIRAAAAAGVNITYKILFNDAVAMTGGQPMDGGLDVPRIARQVAAEGATRIVVLSEEPQNYPADTPWPFGTSVRPRDELAAVQKELAEIGGLSVLIYDQTCAAEKRRRRKRGTLSRSRQAGRHQRARLRGLRRLRRAIELRRHRAGRDRVRTEARHRPVELQQGLLLHQGLLPELRHGARRRGEEARGGARPTSRCPSRRASSTSPATMRSSITGVGGTGVVTIGALLAMAAHLEGRAAAVLDMAGLAQKGGAVTSHVRIASMPSEIQLDPHSGRPVPT